MRCLECNRPVTLPGLVIAMEQREHFAMVRHAEVCQSCAVQMLKVFEKAGEGSRYWRQSVNCAYCNSKLPITRLRFEIKDQFHLHIAVCEQCYRKMRDELVRFFTNFVTFVEKEWQTPGVKGGKRVPWPTGATVFVKSHTQRFGGQTGRIIGFRCLVQPWFGYDVRLADGSHHFFHERDLELDLTSIPEELRVMHQPPAPPPKPDQEPAPAPPPPVPAAAPPPAEPKRPAPPAPAPLAEPRRPPPAPVPTPAPSIAPRRPAPAPTPPAAASPPVAPPPPKAPPPVQEEPVQPPASSGGRNTKAPDSVLELLACVPDDLFEPPPDNLGDKPKK